jgi:hypothetical protein
MAEGIIQNSFASGELSPHLYGRTDLAKYHTGAMFLRNCMVDYRGGVISRPGTQFIGLTNTNQAGRLRRFVFSATQTYILVFTHLGLQFIKNPLTSPANINGSNAGFIETSPGVRYTVTTPYAFAELNDLKFSQSADVMIITHPNHTPMQLIRLADTNWTLSAVAIASTVTPPTLIGAVITPLPTGSTDPQNTNYRYVITAVGQDGQESQPSLPQQVTGINIAATQGTITIRWNAVANAQYYNVYKAVPSPGGVLVLPTSPYGFIGSSYGNEFTDSNIIADFSESPPRNDNPFDNGRVIGFNITNPGTTYPVGATSATVTDPNGATVGLTPLIDNNTAGGTGAIIGFIIYQAGHDVTNGAAISVTGAGGSGFAGTVITTAATGAAPAVSAYFQQRRVYAGSNAQPLTLWGSRPAQYNNFDRSNPTIDSDAYEFTINGEQVNAIKHLLAMPGGLVIFSDGEVAQLTGGNPSLNNPTAVTPSSAVVVPQSSYGASSVEPVKIDKEILYVQSEGVIVRDLAYNVYANIYTSTDLTILSNHLFYPNTILNWAYQDTPFKTIWAIRNTRFGGNNDTLLALAYLKEQDIYGWSHHDTSGGVYISTETVREGSTDAFYMIVARSNGNTCVERMADRQYAEISDCWCLDNAVYTFAGAPTVSVSGLDHLEGMTVRALVNGGAQGPFTVSGGAITLTEAGQAILVGLPYTVQFQQLPPTSPQDKGLGERGRLVSITARIMDTGPGLKFGTSFAEIKPFIFGITSTDPEWITPYQGLGLHNTDIHMNVDAQWDTQGGVCIQMDDPIPFTITAIVNEEDK